MEFQQQRLQGEVDRVERVLNAGAGSSGQRRGYTFTGRMSKKVRKLINARLPARAKEAWSLHPPGRHLPHDYRQPARLQHYARGRRQARSTQTYPATVQYVQQSRRSLNHRLRGLLEGRSRKPRSRGTKGTRMSYKTNRP